jgi:hypothetical protein
MSECETHFFTMGNFAAAQQGIFLQCETALSDRENRRG